MQVSLNCTYRLDVSQEEYNLIGLALAGRLEEKHAKPAAELNRRFLECRAQVHREHLRVVQLALQSLSE